jgi:3-hydroxybutyrate dehydrogenase
MQDKIVLITGSTSGIGLGIAKALAMQKASVIINGFGDPKVIDDEIKELYELGARKVYYAPCDLAKPDDIEKCFNKIRLEFSKIDILINNAGMQFVAPIEDFPPEKWEQIIRIDLIAAFYTIRHVVPLMKKQKWGRIINIASAHAFVASPFKSAYVAAKHGLLGLTKTVALETAEFGITVNAICPGYVKTPLVLNQIADTAKARSMSEEDVMTKIILGVQATKKFVEIEEIAGFVKFLCSNEAASITGAGLSIDGAWTAQ